MGVKQIKFIIPGEPIAKKRHRDFIKPLKNGKFIRGRYNIQRTAESKFISLVVNQIPSEFEPFTEPLFIQLWYGISRPKGHFGSGKNAGKLKPSAPAFPAKIPDIDNYEKFIFDCLNGVVYLDDKLIVSCRHDKRYSKYPRTEILIKEMNHDATT